MHRRTAVAFAVALLAIRPVGADAASWTEREISIDGGAAPLFGVLSMPAGATKTDGILILAGSGPTDRDGNAAQSGLRTDCLKLLAHALTSAGFASLRVDKRLVGASSAAGPGEADLRFDMLVDDAVRWSRRLQAEPAIRRIFLIGHSEGALVATLAARAVRTAGLVLVAGPGFPAGATLRRQFGAADNGLSPELRRTALEIVDALEKGDAVGDVPPLLASAFRPSVQPYLRSWMRHDPAEALTAFAGPALIVQGNRDLQVGEGDARRLVAARPRARLLLIEGMNHVLKAVPAGRSANLATYADPRHPLAPGLVPPIVAFLKE